MSHSDTHVVDYETVLALADNAADKAELAVSAYQALARSADERIRTTRRLSYAAWSLVGVCAVCAVVSVGWASHKLTRAAVETRHLQEQVSTATATADGMNDECDDLRRALAARASSRPQRGPTGRVPRARGASDGARHASDTHGAHRVDLRRGLIGARPIHRTSRGPARAKRTGGVAVFHHRVSHTAGTLTDRCRSSGG